MKIEVKILFLKFEIGSDLKKIIENKLLYFKLVEYIWYIYKRQGIFEILKFPPQICLLHIYLEFDDMKSLCICVSLCLINICF